MKVITENHILITKQGQPIKGMYSAADGKLKKKAGDFVRSGKIQGFLDKFGGGGASSAPSSVAPTAAPSGDTKPKGMSKGLKIGLIVGGAALLLIGGYYLLKPKK